MSDPNLRQQATLRLSEATSSHRVNLGSHSAATTRFGEYPGWEQMAVDIRELAQHTLDSLEDVAITRIGMRYINVLVPDKHLINSIHDLKIQVSIDDKKLEGGLNVNFTVFDKNALHTIRIASPEFVSNLSPNNGTALVDIDSSTTDTGSLVSVDDIVAWANEAHKSEKEIFFQLFTEKTLNEIVEEWE